MEFPNFAFTHLLRELVFANCARFFTELLGTIRRLDSLRLAEELRQRKLLKWTGVEELTCFKFGVTWSTDNCLRRAFLPSFAGLTLTSIDFCLRKIFLLLFGRICCRMVDIFLSFTLPNLNDFLVFFPASETTQQNIFMVFIAIR